MKHSPLFILPLLFITHAVYAQSYTDMAKVTQVTPRYETVNTPQQQCQMTQESVPQERSLSGAILGGVTGAIVGSQIGGGSGRIATGAVGAGIGAIVGDRIDNSNNGVVTRNVQRCVQVDQLQQVVRGYDVTYSYNNQTYQTFLTSMVKPGDAIRVKVEVTPY